MIRLSNLRLTIHQPLSDLDDAVMKALHLKGDPPPYTIIKESLDARRREDPAFVYQVAVDLPWGEKEVRRLKNKDIQWAPQKKETPLMLGKRPLPHPPVIVGAGPAGLFAAYTLAKHGYKPLVLEQGEDTATRSQTVEHFWKTGALNPQSNVQFGEGGAGAFSDGKLTSRSKNPLNQDVRQILVDHGAPDDVLYAVKAHVGTDILKDVMVSMRMQIIAWGGSVRFGVQVHDLAVTHGRVTGLQTSEGFIPAGHVLLAIGHSARGFFRQLHAGGLAMESKPFAVGFRIEHPQSMIDRVQYHGIARTPRLGAASYQLTWHDDTSGRGIYTFCMCPGGKVINASSEAGRLAVNGMSYHARDLQNANSAILATVTAKDFGPHVLSGLTFQEEVEAACYELGDGGFIAPVQHVGDFLKADGAQHNATRTVTPTITPGYVWRDLSALYPAIITDALRRGIAAMDRNLPGFALEDAVLTAAETRSSSPVRLLRHKDTFESLNIQGIFPIGEGAGYAGGIASSAIDGMACAHFFMSQYKPF